MTCIAVISCAYNGLMETTKTVKRDGYTVQENTINGVVTWTYKGITIKRTAYQKRKMFTFSTPSEFVNQSTPAINRRQSIYGCCQMIDERNWGK